jgi:hypothetical protein
MVFPMGNFPDGGRSLGFILAAFLVGMMNYFALLTLAFNQLI